MGVNIGGVTGQSVGSCGRPSMSSKVLCYLDTVHLLRQDPEEVIWKIPKQRRVPVPVAPGLLVTWRRFCFKPTRGMRHMSTALCTSSITLLIEHLKRPHIKTTWAEWNWFVVPDSNVLKTKDLKSNFLMKYKVSLFNMKDSHQ